MGQGGGRRYEDPGALVSAKPNIDATLVALADPHRRRALELLVERPHRAGELAEALDLPAPAMSRHLRALKQGRLVEETHPEFDARVRIYALKEGAMSDLKQWLAQMDRLWSIQLSAFKAHVEKPPR